MHAVLFGPQTTGAEYSLNQSLKISSLTMISSSLGTPLFAGSVQSTGFSGNKLYEAAFC